MSEALAQMPARSQYGKFSEVKTIGEALRHPEMIARFKQAVPQHMSADRMLRVMALAVQKTPKLVDCDMMSLLGAMLVLGSLGLEPNTPLGLAYLIPYERRGQAANGKWHVVATEVQVVIGYRGYIELARRSGCMISLHADVAYSGDVFSFEYGSGSHLRHIPGIKRETPDWAYCHVKLTDGGEAFEVLPYAEVLKIRDNSDGYKAAMRNRDRNPAGFAKQPWVANEHEMATKTLVRRIAKWLPMAIEMTNAAMVDMVAERGGVNYAAIAKAPVEAMRDMGQIGYEEYIPPIDIGQRRDEPEYAEPVAAAEKQEPPAKRQQQRGNGAQRLDPAKYPPGETLDQAKERVVKDQQQYGVAEGERDLRPAPAKSTPALQLYLLDEDGQVIEMYGEPMAYVVALDKLVGSTAADFREAVWDHNREYVVQAGTHPDAAKLLAILQDNIEAGDALAHMVAVPVPARGKTPDLKAYVEQLTASLKSTVHHAGELGEWQDTNGPVFAAMPKATRQAIAQAIAAHCKALGLDEPPQEQRVDVDAERATGYVDQIRQVTDHNDLAAVDRNQAFATVMARWNRERPELFSRVNDALQARNQELSEDHGPAIGGEENLQAD